MLRSHQILLVLLVVAFAGFAFFSGASLGASPLDVAAILVFGIALAAMAYIWLPVSRARSVAGKYGLPRWVWVLFASYAAALALAMLLALAAMPWAGYQGFEFFFGGEHSWALLVLGVLLFPLVRWRLQ